MTVFEFGGVVMTIVNVIMGLLAIGFAGRRLWLTRLGIERRRRVFALWAVIFFSAYPMLVYFLRIVEQVPDPIPAFVARPMTAALYTAILVVLIGDR